MYGYIYKITNLVNNKIYIGKRSSSQFDKQYYGGGKLIKLALKKYGKENFSREIVEWCESHDELVNREIYWIKFYNARNHKIGYNISFGGEGESRPTSEETRLKLSKALKGLKRTDEQKINYSIAAKNRIYNKERFIKGIETKRKKRLDPNYKPLQSKLKGRKLSEEHKQKIKNNAKNNPNYGNKGRHWSDEYKQKMSEKLKGFHHTEKTKQLISEKLKGKTPWNKGHIYDKEYTKKLSKISLDKQAKWMYKNTEQLKVPKNKIEIYLTMGWEFGRPKHKVWITNGKITKCVKLDELDMYLSNNWKKGRK